MLLQIILFLKPFTSLIHQVLSEILVGSFRTSQNLTVIQDNLYG